MSARINSLKVHTDLLRLGFVINEEKSHWPPLQIIVWLGLVLNTKDGKLSVTDQRVTKLKSCLNSLYKCYSRVVYVKELAPVVGQIIYLSPVVGHLARIMTRSMYAVINEKISWFFRVKLSEEAVEKINFWNQNLDFVNDAPAWKLEFKLTKSIYSDASDHACAAFVRNQEVVFHQNWSESKRFKSSTWRELKTVSLAITSSSDTLHDQNIAWFTDNQNFVSIVHKGSKIKELQTLALKIFSFCLKNGISLEMKWIPRELNVDADSLSKMIDFDDYCLNDKIFNMLDSKWGPHTVDRFACHYNKKLMRFNSRFYQPGAEAVDAFLQDWEFGNNWLLPPVCLIPRVISHMRACKAEGTLVMPMWKSSQFWTLLCNDGIHWNSMVHDWCILPNINNLFIRKKAKNRLFGTKPLTFEVVALRINFSIPPRVYSEGFCIE